MRVIAVVVTYNRSQMLVDCLQALLSQTHELQKILVVDNASSDGTAEVLRLHGLMSDERINYLRLETNMGGAGGFHYGLEMADKLSSDWVWVMDDDVVPDTYALEQLVRYLQTTDQTQVTGLACRVLTTEQDTQVTAGRFDASQGLCSLGIHDYSQRIIEVDYSVFLGLLIRASVIKTIGLPKADFFIWYDDVEYCLRMRSIGKILLVTSSKVIHRNVIVPDEQKNFLGFSVRNHDIKGYWKELCGFRNYEYIMRSYGQWPLYKSLLRVLKRTLRIALVDDHKFIRIRWIWKYYLNSFQREFCSLKPDEWKNIVENNSSWRLTEEIHTK